MLLQLNSTDRWLRLLQHFASIEQPASAWWSD
jgi:hypothetical protein